MLIIDNASTDDTRSLLETCLKDKKLKLIFNKRNFGHIRSPYWAMMQTTRPVLYLASDMQDPHRVSCLA